MSELLRQAWPGCSEVLDGSTRTIRQCYELPASQLEVVLQTVVSSIEREGADEVYKRAGNAVLEATPARSSIIDSETAFALMLPACVALARFRHGILAKADLVRSSIPDAWDLADDAWGSYCRTFGVPAVGGDWDAQAVNRAATWRSRVIREPALPTNLREIDTWNQPIDVSSSVWAATSWGTTLQKFPSAANDYEIAWYLANSEVTLTTLSDVSWFTGLNAVHAKCEGMKSFGFLEKKPDSWEDAVLAARLLIVEGVRTKADRCIALIAPSEWTGELAEMSAEYGWDQKEIEAQRQRRTRVAASVEAELRLLQEDYERALNLVAPRLAYEWWLGKPDDTDNLVLGFLMGRASVDAALQMKLEEIRSEVRGMRLIQQTQFDHQVGVGVRLEQLSKDVRSLEDLCLDAMNAVQNRQERLDETSAAEAIERLVSGWRAAAGEKDTIEREATARSMVGIGAWDQLQEESRTQVLGYLLLRQRPEPQLWRIAGAAICIAFENEVRAALIRAGAHRKGIPHTLERLLMMAREIDLGGRLNRIADAAAQGRMVGVNGLRNRCIHGEPFTSEDLQGLASLLLVDGLDGRGLIGMVATWRQPGDTA